MYSLPELNHWRRCVGVCNVGGIFSVVVNTVLCGYTMRCYYFWRACCVFRCSCGIEILGDKNNTPEYFCQQGEFPLFYPLFPPPTCIPIVATASPRQLSGEAVEEVEDGPGKDHYIVHV